MQPQAAGIGRIQLVNKVGQEPGQHDMQIVFGYQDLGQLKDGQQTLILG
jgi:hypothetical protein